MNDKKIIEIAEKYNLGVCLNYTVKNNKILRNYWFTNSPYSLEIFFESEDFKNLNMSENKFAYELFCIYNIKYSQENEFFID